MLEAPRALLAWAPALLEAPPKALVFRDVSLLGIWRLPILFPPPLPRLAPMLLGLALALEPAPFLAFPPILLALAPALEPPRFAAVAPLLLAPAPAFDPPRFAAFTPVLFGLAPAFEPARFPAAVPWLLPLGCLVLNPCCCRAFACRVDMESPRVAPPY